MEALGPSGPYTVGPYRVAALLGRGGMGQVLLCVAPDGRLVAVKQVLAELAEDDGFRARFRREVEASRKVSGAHTAPVVDADLDAPRPWLASVFVPGPSLRETLDVAGPLPEDAVRRLAAGLAHALSEVHRAGLVHRDLKPSNVMLAEDGARLIDFGIVRAVEGDGRTELTHTGALVGSPGFMSPEQALGREVTPASDVFSFGATLVAACTGHAPFTGRSTPQTLYNVVHAEPDLSAVPPGLRGIVEASLAKEPGARPSPERLPALIGRVEPSTRPWPPEVHRLIADQHAEIDRYAGSMRAPAPPSTSPTPLAPPRGRRGGLVIGLAVAAVVVLLGGAALGLNLLPDGKDRASASTTPATSEKPYGKGPVPTPGNTPLSQVRDKYTGRPPTCKQASARVKVPSGFMAPSGNGVNRQEVAGTAHIESMCVWHTRTGDELYLMWYLFRDEGGPGTGAEKAKKRFEEYYWPGENQRDFTLGYAEEGLWKTERKFGESCILWVRDVNLIVFVQMKGKTYPAGKCEPITKALGKSGVASMVGR